MAPCFVPFCKSGYSNDEMKALKEKGEHPGMFSFPKDPVMRQRWLHAARRDNVKVLFNVDPSERLRLREQFPHYICKDGKELILDPLICERHFAESDMIRRQLGHRLEDGSARKYPRKFLVRLKNKETCIPSVFPDFPPHLQKKPPKERKTRSQNNLSEKNEPLEESHGQLTENEEFQEGKTDEEMEIPKEEGNERQKFFGDLLGNTLIDLPPNWIKHVDKSSNTVSFIRHASKTFWIDATITLGKIMDPVIKFHNREVPRSVLYITDITSHSTLLEAIQDIENCNLCIGNDNTFSDYCEFTTNNNKPRCTPCENMKHALKMAVQRKRSQATIVGAQPTKLQQKRRRKSYKLLQLEKTTKQLRDTVLQQKEKIEQMSEDATQNVLNQVPETMRETVLTCMQMGRVKGKTGMRYSQKWSYECLLMKLKSPKLYRHLQESGILPLPSESTLRSYIKNIQATYGFQDALFEVLATKTKNMESREKHGVLLIDEMKVSEATKFDPNQLKVIGFVDLGQHTPKSKETELGDHGLTFMFQSICGGWNQVIGCFLSRGCCDGEKLARLTTEAIILLENSGLHVDGVVTDGASWNRTMWKKFGLDKGIGQNTQHCCPHPVDEKRRLHFLSDFPHLVKCARNNFLDRQGFMVPNGYVQPKHWELILMEDESKAHKNLKLMPNLTLKKFNAKDSERQKVSWAFQVFSNSAAAAITIRREKGVANFEDSQASSDFAKKMNDLCDAMNSNNRFTALKSGSESELVIREFLQFLEEWEAHCKKINSNQFLSHSTAHGFYVTLLSVLGLMEDLINTETDIQYILTRRLNQDALEHFFGLVRGCGGASSHPNAVQFAQLVKILSVYSLVKPPKGSNISGSELIQTLATVEDLKAMKTIAEKKARLSQDLDKILDDGTQLELIPQVLNDHDYLQPQDIDEFATCYFAGYVARKAKKWCGGCEHCQRTLISNVATPSARLIELKSKGFLTFPSKELESMVTFLEICVQSVAAKKKLCSDYIFELVAEVQLAAKEERRLGKLPLVGCSNLDHQKSLSKAIIKFFLFTRLHFLCKAECGDNFKQRIKAKQAKYT